MKTNPTDLITQLTKRQLKSDLPSGRLGMPRLGGFSNQPKIKPLSRGPKMPSFNFTNKFRGQQV